MNAINWRDLNVYFETTDKIANTLGRLLDDAKRGINSLGDLELREDGSMKSWTSFFVAADGEQPDWSTPDVAVDWTGFEAAVDDARAVEASLNEAA